ncbi:MAG: hypothetical protein JNJ57_21505 [Saprospiraceae bacterium]|nr:hypothetical protein [Saprospiraceae bacterium]
MMRYLLFLAFLPGLLSAQPTAEHNLSFDEVPQKWHEGLPLGNGLLGCLVWQKDGKLRLALDRADLWDLRLMSGLDRPEFRYQWVAEQVAKGEYGIVQEYFDAPYEREAGPTKLPGGAIELDGLGSDRAMPGGAHLDISNGMAVIKTTSGKRFETFVHATRREGWFRCSGFPNPEACFQLLAPKYSAKREAGNANSVQGSDLARLGYPQSEVFERKGVWLFHQSGWGGFSYEIAVALKKQGNGVWEGVWSISSHFVQKMDVDRAENIVRKAIKRGFDQSFKESAARWQSYWSKSSVALPDPLIERQYYLDMYKFGCTARENGPMISLQAVWTADNGRLPPWKGDLHHDLNTQMSYWPAYTSNHLPEGLSYLKHLESNDAAHRAYTKKYFGTPGLNVPGVSTLLGAEMGGWIQYSCSPTVAAWCAQHFYLHWRYSKDRKFLRQHAWPWLHDAALHLEALLIKDSSGKKVLPLSSSPEIHDNSIQAWFPNTWTNYDLALALFLFEKTAELAVEMGLDKEAAHWQKVAGELPEFALEPNGSLKFSPSLPYEESHRHFSHLMAIHPLGHFDNSVEGQRIMQTSLHLLDSIGPAAWCGYSWAWLGNLRARTRDGAGAREALRIFAEAFVSKNSFHLNGDQSGKGYSGFTYDPFTLEGNFAFAAGVQEMLLQSHNGIVRVFPAIPADWKQVSFQNLRAEGAFLVSAELGKVVTVTAEHTGYLNLLLPEGTWIQTETGQTIQNRFWQGTLKKGQQFHFQFQ